MRATYRPAALLLLLGPLLLVSCTTVQYPAVEEYTEPQYSTQYDTQTYTDNQTLTVAAQEGEFSLQSYFRWSSADLAFEGSPYLHYYGYEVPDWPAHDSIRLRITPQPQMQYEPAIVRVFDVTETGQLSSPDLRIYEELPPKPPNWYVIRGTAAEFWLQAANVWANRSKFLGAIDYPLSTSPGPHVITLEAGKARSLAVIISGNWNEWNARISMDVLWTGNSVEYREVTRQRQVPREVVTQVKKQRTVYRTRQAPFWEAFLQP